MSVSSIRNPWLRRSVLIIGFVPLFVAQILLSAAIGIVEAVKDMRYAIPAAWRGR